MHYLKKAAASAVAVILAVGTVSAHAYSDITVKLDALTGKAPEIVNFMDYEPIQHNSTTLAPVRTLAESAGMEVEWNQELQTANIRLSADKDSYKPVEVYAAKVIDKIQGYGLDLTPSDITASLKLDDNVASLRYNFVDTDGDVVSIGKKVEMTGAATLVNDSTLMVPVRGTMEMFGLNVKWDQSDMSLKISIPDDEDITVPNGLQIVADAQNPYTPAAETVVSQTVEEDSPVNTDPALGKYIGRFKITHYAPGAADNGIWGNATAWAGDIAPGRTIAVDPNVIPKLSWVYVDGYGLRRAEDCGGAVKGYHIDMAVWSYSEAMRLGVVYKDVYWAE